MKTKFFPAFAACLFFLGGCEVDPPVVKPANMFEFNAKHSAPVQAFAIDGAAGGTVVTDAGVEIIIPDSAFRDYSGNLVNGGLTLEVTELFHKSDMVLSGYHTMGTVGWQQRRLLESAGMFHIELKQNGSRSYAYNAKLLTISIPTETINREMKLFQAWRNIDPGFALSGFEPVNSLWALVPDSAAAVSGTIDFDTLPPLKYILTTGLGFINCDRFVDYTNIVPITVKISDSFDPMNIAVYLALNDLNSVVNLNRNYADTTMPIEYTTPSIPISQPATVIAIGIKEDGEYLGVKDIVVTPNQVVNVQMKPATEQEILREMERLDER